MSTKPELLIPAGSVQEVQQYIEAGADAVLVGEQKFGMRLPGDMTLEEIREAASFAHAKGAKLYVQVNNIMDNEILPELPAYLSALQSYQVDGISFGDPAVIISCRQHAPNLKLHWNAEMTSTNYATANYWARKGAVRVILARELNMEQVVEINQKVDMEVQVQIHGMTNIYHSKRSLVANYMGHLGNDEGQDTSMNRNLFLIEAERQDEQYPIYEDRNGTHIMSSEDLCMIDNMEEILEAGFASLKIESLLKTAKYNETIVRLYRKAIDAYFANPEEYQFEDEWLEEIRKIQDPDRELSYGFFYKEQVY